jgi:hypothetical protein
MNIKEWVTVLRVYMMLVWSCNLLISLLTIIFLLCMMLIYSIHILVVLTFFISYVYVNLNQTYTFLDFKRFWVIWFHVLVNIAYLSYFLSYFLSVINHNPFLSKFIRSQTRLNTIHTSSGHNDPGKHCTPWLVGLSHFDLVDHLPWPILSDCSGPISAAR